MRISSPFRYIFLWKPLFRLCLCIIMITTLIYVLNLKWKKDTAEDNILFEHKISDTDLGSYGVAVHVSELQKKDVEAAYRVYGFNQVASDMISVSRPLHDMRHPKCKLKQYVKNNLKVSVIIVFYEEGWSTLIRTVMSVINRSSKESLLEVILVDDHSTLSHLKEKLDNFCKSMNGLVKVVRMAIHEGLIRARIHGADAARGDVLIFLDSHCEASPGWLPPLLDPISNDYRTVTCPTIDGIEHNTFEYRPYGRTARGTFSWQFHYKERPAVNPEDGDYGLVASPVMAGGLFAISNKFWLELGKYDPGLYIWGGEQYEISFKLWMCGGTMYNVPCSKVGHVYRGPGIIRGDQGLSQIHPHAIDVNYKRVAEVWMDEYKHFLYMKRPNIRDAQNFEKGLEERHDLRKELNCRSFRWYLENVVNDTLHTAYEPDRALSTIENKALNKCIITRGDGREVELGSCYGGTTFRWTWINEIREEEHCLTIRDSKLIWDWCRENYGNQHFLYKEDFTIYNDESNKCIGFSGNILTLTDCDPVNLSKQWHTEMKNLSKPDPWAKFGIHNPRQS